MRRTVTATAASEDEDKTINGSAHHTVFFLYAHILMIVLYKQKLVAANSIIYATVKNKYEMICLGWRVLREEDMKWISIDGTLKKVCFVYLHKVEIFQIIFEYISERIIT